jgi:hypothetical protein
MMIADSFAASIGIYAAAPSPNFFFALCALLHLASLGATQQKIFDVADVADLR